MSLKVIGAGFGRTGTLSTYTALNQLGYPCYHMIEVLEKNGPSHLNFWYEVATSDAGMQHDWERVFGNYRAAVDNPACCVWKELSEAYPDAKVILTLHPRGPEAWYESTIETIYFTENRWQFKVLETLIPKFRKFGTMSEKLIWKRSHKGTMENREKAIAHYKQHIEDVRATISPERLLIFTADQGWEPLCAFLGVDVPATPFPNVNDRAQIKDMISKLIATAYIALGLIALLLAGLIWGLTKL